MVEVVLNIFIKFKPIEISNQSYLIRFLRKIKEQDKIQVSGMLCLTQDQKRIGKIWKL
jgi:hypothetical protein